MRHHVLGLPLCLALALSACIGDLGGDDDDSELGKPGGQVGEDEADKDPTSDIPEKTALDDRVVDYHEALRTASLKLLRTLPTLAQIKKLEAAADRQLAYEQELDAMLADPRFAERMIKYWRDTMRQGGGATEDRPSRDTAPILAARVVAEGKPFSTLFTSPSNNCPGYDGETKTFVDGECGNGAPAEAGVLTNPGVMHQFYGNMAFRRVRWVQEIFVCTKFPAEYSDTPVEKGGADYVSPWPFESISGAPIDFLDTKSVICANCHTTLNHIAPLFAHFDQQGMWTDGISVNTPLTPDPITTELSHWLPAGETTAWRLGKPVADLVELGAEIAADPTVAECAVARAWNFVMSKEDIVSDLATVPYEVLEPYMVEFQGNGQDLKALMRTMFASEDFTSF